MESVIYLGPINFYILYIKLKMQNEVVDRKIKVLYDNYRDNVYAKDA